LRDISLIGAMGYKGFGSFGGDEATHDFGVGVMRPVTPHSRQSCQPILEPKKVSTDQ
jgi:hypothetical protein